MNSFTSMDVDDNPEVLEQGFDEIFDPPAPDAYECPICLLVLNKPMQTVCGHRFCRGCILKVLREGRPNCPIDNELLSESQIYPDNFARREILSLTVHCHNSREFGCQWMGPLKVLEKHHEDCEFANVLCPNNCGIKIARSELKEHQETACPRRIVSCDYCNIKVVYQRLVEHRERCNRFPVDCPNSCSIGKIPREELEKHMEFDCPKSVVKCPFRDAGCTFEGTREDVDEHVSKGAGDHMRSMMKSLRALKKSQDENTVSIRKLNETGYGGDKASIFESPWNGRDGNILKAEMDKLAKKLRDLELKTSQWKSGTDMFRNEYRQTTTDFESKFDQLNQTVQELQTLTNEINARVWCGKFIWRITNFDNLFKQAQSGDVPAIHSLPFYTGVPGYKMCLRVNLNGIDSGANSHVSMFVHLMQGEFDSVIEWPFPGSITLTIMDQDTRSEPQHVKETLTARPTLQAFLRPKTNRNHKGYGYVEMMPHSTLRTYGYIKDDTMVVRVDVKMPNR